MGGSANLVQDGSLTIEHNYLAMGIWRFGTTWQTIVSNSNTVIRTTFVNPGVTLPPNITVLASDSTNRVDVVDNDYETGRGFIVIYNWESLSSVNVDLTPITDLVGGTDSINVWSIYDLTTTVFSGLLPANKTISIPMASRSCPLPLGDTTNLGGQYVQSSEFMVFLVRKI